jgi:hypothetical protein
MVISIRGALRVPCQRLLRTPPFGGSKHWRARATTSPQVLASGLLFICQDSGTLRAPPPVWSPQGSGRHAGCLYMKVPTP